MTLVVAGMEEANDEGPPSGADAGHVFISHVEENADLALRLADGLEHAGYGTWCYERDAVPGPSYLLQTARQIEESAAVVLLISPDSLGSHQVTAEVVRAHESGRPFIPLLIGISHVEFAARQPEWREALGSSTSIALPAAGVDAVLPRVCQGLEGLGVSPREGHEARPLRAYITAPTTVTVAASAGETAGSKQKKLVVVAALVVAALLVAVGIGVVLAAGGGGGGEVAGRAGSDTNASTPGGGTAASTVPSTPGDAPAAAEVAGPASAASPTTIAATPTAAGGQGVPAVVATAPAPQPSASPTTSPPPPPTTQRYASADDTPISTSAGSLEVLDAYLTDEWCSFDGECLTASGSGRYLVLDLVRADGYPATMPPGFVNEANQSSVSFEGGQAGTQRVVLDEYADVIEVVYGFVPATAGGGDVLLHWPGNNPLRLTLS